MNREEKIQKAAYNNDRESSQENQQYFIEGAKWADENPREELVDIEKVCEYIKDNLYKFLYVCDGEAGFPTASFIKDLRKAMEE